MITPVKEIYKAMLGKDASVLYYGLRFNATIGFSKFMIESMIERNKVIINGITR